MPNNKSPGNDSLSKEFYETFWEELKKPFMLAVKRSYNIKQLSVSQRQAVIKLIEKKKEEIKDLLKIGDQYHCLMLTLS